MSDTAKSQKIPLAIPHSLRKEEILPSLTSAELTGYLQGSVPRDGLNFNGQVPERERKHFLVINPVHLIDRKTPFGEMAWMEMVEHHLFPGHSSCNMVFELFYHDYRINLPELIEVATEEGSVSAFTLLIVAWLNDNGYHYDDRHLKSDTGEVFDGVLLDICW